MKDNQKLIYKCTSVGHMSTSFNRACAHPFWKQSIKYCGNNIDAYISSKLLVKNIRTCPSA